MIMIMIMIPKKVVFLKINPEFINEVVIINDCMHLARHISTCKYFSLALQTHIQPNPTKLSSVRNEERGHFQENIP